MPGTALLYALFGWPSSSSLLAQLDFPSSLELVCCFLYVFFPHSLHPITHGWNSTAPSAPSQSLIHVHSETQMISPRSERLPGWHGSVSCLRSFLYCCLPPSFSLHTCKGNTKLLAYQKEEYYPCVSLQHPVLFPLKKNPSILSVWSGPGNRPSPKSLELCMRTQR